VVKTIINKVGNGDLYSSLPLHFKQGMEVYIHLYHLHLKWGMEVYIHLYHFISSGEWRFIFIFTTYISSGEWRFIIVFTTSFQVVPTLNVSGKDEYKPPFPA
jgi:hypothetical protein